MYTMIQTCEQFQKFACWFRFRFDFCVFV